MSEAGIDQGISIRFGKILVPTDFSELSNAVVPYGAALARRLGSILYVAHVIPSSSYEHLAIRDRGAALTRLSGEAEKQISDLLSSDRFKGVRYQGLVDHGEVWPELSSMVTKNGIDLIVTGMHGWHGVRKLVSGSMAEEIFSLAPCAVLLVGPEVNIAHKSEERLERILYATDFSAESKGAMEYAYELAKISRAKLYFLHIVGDVWSEPVSTRMSPDAFFRQRLLEEGWPEHELGIEPEYLVEFGSPEALPVEVARKHDVQLMVLNAPGTSHPDLAAHLPGPLAYNIASHSPCPVLIVRGTSKS